MSEWASPESHQAVCDALNFAIVERDRFRNALAMFADPESWIRLEAPSMKDWYFCWNKLGDFADPQEFARLALEGE